MTNQGLFFPCSLFLYLWIFIVHRTSTHFCAKPLSLPAWSKFMWFTLVEASVRRCILTVSSWWTLLESHGLKSWNVPGGVFLMLTGGGGDIFIFNVDWVENLRQNVKCHLFVASSWLVTLQCLFTGEFFYYNFFVTQMISCISCLWLFCTKFSSSSFQYSDFMQEEVFYYKCLKSMLQHFNILLYA